MPQVPTRFTAAGAALTKSTGVLGMEQTPNRQQNAAQRLVGSSTAAARGSLIGAHNIISAVPMVGGVPKKFDHKLGRQPQGAFPVLITGPNLAGPAAWCVISLTATSVTAQTSANATVDWLVF